MVVKIDIYGLKSSRAEFRSKLATLLHNIGYTPSKLDPYLWIRPAIKSDVTEYYKYALVHIDGVLVISCVPMKTIEGIKCVFKLKGDKEEPPDMYLVASLEKLETKGGTKFWSMSAKKYVKAAVVNLEATLSQRAMRLTISHSPMPTNYHPSEDVSNALNTRLIQTYQELVEIRWEFKIGQVNIFL